VGHSLASFAFDAAPIAVERRRAARKAAKGETSGHNLLQGMDKRAEDERMSAPGDKKGSTRTHESN
jgi:hypothetical protein